MKPYRKEKICMFTGHRKIKESHAVELPLVLSELLERLINEGYTDFRAGGAMGFDTMAALKVIEKKAIYEHIKLHLFLPCVGQDKGWSETARAAYRFVLDRADSITYAEERFKQGCMQKRNRQMVDGSHLCVAYFEDDATGQLDIFGNTKRKKPSGGTGYTVDYAAKKGIDIINLY